MQRHLYEHYSSVGHCGFLEHVSITLIDETDPSYTLKREDYWRRTLCTTAPCGLNIEKYLWRTFTALHLYDKKYLVLLTSFTTVQQFYGK